MINPLDMKTYVSGPLCQVWEQRIEASKRARKRFDAVRRQCMDFFGSSAGFMWDRDHNKDYFDGNLPKPKFQITINKAFEFVSIYGPSLFWQYPTRKVMSQRTLELVPEIFGDPQDPFVQQMFQQYAQRDQLERGRQNFVNKMMENYLDWSQREQPNGGLIGNGVMCITDALLSGRGCLWPETYYFPGSDTPYTQLRFDSVANLYIDADCNDPYLESAGYIMRRHVTPAWQVERMFSLKKNSLAKHAKMKSQEQIVREEAAKSGADARGAGTFDCIEWYEIWSKVGVGPRMNGAENNMLDRLDEVVGDYAYLCIAPGVKYPLNAPVDKFFGDDGWDDEEVSQAFEWRACNYGHALPAYKDNRWPVALLDFNRVPNSPYPLAPLGPGLGELIALNVLMSAYVDMAWENRKTILGYYKSAAEDMVQALESDDAFVRVPLNDVMQKSITDVMQILQRPEANRDILQAISMVSASFDKRVGLNELLYGNAGATQIRVAADIRERSTNSSIRPQKMAGDVAAWMSEASQLEMFLASMHVRGESLTHLLGSVGAAVWDEEFGEATDQLLREMKATVEASEVRRPNKERDTANVQSLQQYVLPLLQNYAQSTGDTEPLNAFFERVGQAMEMDTRDFHLPPWQAPEPDPEEVAMQQQLQQATTELQLQKLAAEVEDKQAGAAQKQAAAQQNMVSAELEVQKLAADIEDKQASAFQRQAAGQNDLVKAATHMVQAGVAQGDVREMEHMQRLRHDAEAHEQQMIHDQERHVQQLLFNESDYQMDAAAETERILKDLGEF